MDVLLVRKLLITSSNLGVGQIAECTTVIGQTLQPLQRFVCIRRTILVSFPVPIHFGWFGSETENNFKTRMLLA